MKNKVTIENKSIGDGHSTYIIAEIGSNHNRDIKIAKKLINKAAEANVDAVKFQTYSADKLYSKKTPIFSKDKIKPYDLIKSIEIPREWHKELIVYSKSKGLHFLSTPFDKEAVNQLEKVGVPAFKVASFEITDLELLKHIASKNKPVILSTGLANLGEIEEALNIIRDIGNNEIILLHCNSLYPSPPDIVNLQAINTMKNAFKIPIGFSDHTLGWHIPVAAVALGSNVIEKHFTLDRNMKGPDHSFAIEPDELKKMVSYIREVETAQGTGIKEKSKAEQEMYKKGRRSIIAKTDIPKGTKISRDMLIIKRPGYGIEPKYLDIIIGREAKVDINSDEWLLWSMI